MKIVPVASGGGRPGISLSNQQSTSDRVSAAKSIAAGDGKINITKSDTFVDPEVLAERLNIKKIKMRTNVSPDRFVASPETEASTTDATGATPDTVVPAEVVEETKPLSPQVAALAKERRAIQRERMELENLKKELSSKQPLDGSQELIDRLKSKPLSVLQEYGVTYDQLTEAILSQSDGINPEIQNLKAEIKALKEGVDKTLLDRDQAAEQQVLTEMLNEAERIAQEGDEFSLIKDEDESAYREVLNRIYNTYKRTGQVLEVRDVMKSLENELLEKRLKYASHEKIKSRLTPPQTPQPVQQKQNYIRTLTNRDASSVGLSRRERAIMAASGTTKG